jgi:hypothetical protein
MACQGPVQSLPVDEEPRSIKHGRVRRIIPPGFRRKFRSFVGSYPARRRRGEFRKLHCAPPQGVHDSMSCAAARCLSPHASFVRAYGSQDAFACVELDA